MTEAENKKKQSIHPELYTISFRRRWRRRGRFSSAWQRFVNV